MAEWVPLLPSLVWPLFILGLLLWFRDHAKTILGAVAERVRSGASIEAGPSGLKLGAVQTPAPADTVRAVDTRAVDSLPHPIYLTLQSFRDPTLDRGSSSYYRLRISLDADEPGMLDDVEKVLYHLHPTFRDPDRTATAAPTSRFRRPRGGSST